MRSMSARSAAISAATPRVASPPTSTPASPSPTARTAITPPASRCCSRSCATRGSTCRRRQRADWAAGKRKTRVSPPGFPLTRCVPTRLEAERLGHADPLAGLDLRQERGVRALADVGTERDLRAVEDVLVALDRFQPLDEAVERQVLAGVLQALHREVGGDIAVDRADVGIDVELLLVVLDEGLDRGHAAVDVGHLCQAHAVEALHARRGADHEIVDRGRT